MVQTRLRAAFMRGGTSKALVFHAADLPADQTAWDRLFLAAMGSPDPNGRQLDGMGGGLSSTSKVCVVGPSADLATDVAYTFGQVLVDRATVDYSGNCGNMVAAVGPFAVDEGLVRVAPGSDAVVRILNTNTGKTIVARFPVVDGKAVVQGDLRIDGVAGSGAPVRLDFLDPGGAKTGRLLPTGRALDRLTLGDGRRIDASLVDAANPCVFVRASDLACSGVEPVEHLEGDATLLNRLELIRVAASVAMGLAPDPAAVARLGSIPKVAMVAAAQPTVTLAGQGLSPADYDIAIRMISMGRPHRAVPMTGAICLAAAVRVAGSVPSLIAGHVGGDVRIGHPSGVVVVDAVVEKGSEGPRVRQGTLLRTARRLFDGEVLLDLSR